MGTVLPVFQDGPVAVALGIRANNPIERMVVIAIMADATPASDAA